MNESNVTEYAAALIEWVDGLVLNGKSGRRAVFVERSLKRQYKKTIASAAKIRKNQLPLNWTKGLEDYKLMTLWQININICRKFKVEMPEDFKFRKLLYNL